MRGWCVVCAATGSFGTNSVELLATSLKSRQKSTVLRPRARRMPSLRTSRPHTQRMVAEHLSIAAPQRRGVKSCIAGDNSPRGTGTGGMTRGALAQLSADPPPRAARR